MKLEWYRFLEFLIKKNTNRNSKSSRINLFYAYILQKRFHNSYKAVIQLILI
jgi:hypothetical protein